MGFPTGVQTVVLTGHVGLADGQSQRDTITLTPSPPEVVSTTADFILDNTPITVVPDRATGQFSIRLLATDATGFNPTGWTYTVARGTRTPYSISLPAATSPVDLADLTPVSVNPGVYDLLIRTSDLPAATTSTAGIVQLGQATDIASAGPAAAAGTTTKAADAGHVHPIDTLLPGDSNLSWWNFPGINAGGANVPSAVNVPGKLTLARAVFHRAVNVSKLWFGVSANDAGATFVNCFAGVYSVSGTTGALACSTSDFSSSLHVSAVYSPALTPSGTLPAGEYFVAWLMGAGSTWTTWNLKSSLGGVTANAGVAVPHLNLANLGSGLSALPATIDLSTMTTSLITGGWGSQWYGLS